MNGLIGSHTFRCDSTYIRGRSIQINPIAKKMLDCKTLHLLVVHQFEFSRCFFLVRSSLLLGREVKFPACIKSKISN